MLTKKTKKYKSKRIANIFEDAGEIERSKFTQNSIDAAKNAFSKDNLGKTLGGIGSGVMGIVDASLANAKVDTTTADNAIDAVNSFQPSTGSLSALSSSYNNLNFADTSYDYKDYMVSGKQGLGNMGKAAMSGAVAGAQVGGPWGAVIGGAVGLLGSGAGWLAGKSKAKNEAIRLETESLMANADATNKALSARDSILENSTNTLMRNIVAKGGKLNIPNRNMFNIGGSMHQHGGIFSNGIVTIDNGGTHENNPFEGVQIGVDNQGVPNLVEEGEVIWNDYVFSNRLKPSKKFKEKYKMKGVTFADVAKYMQRESEERPNDSISKNGLNSFMSILMAEQEKMRQKNSIKNNNKFPKGGFIEFEEEPVVEDNTGIDLFWGAAKTPEQRLAVMELDPTNAAYKKPKSTNINRSSWLRYAPVFGSALGVLSDITGVTNKPDYTDVDNIRRTIDNIRPVSYRPVGTKLSFNPFDTEFYSGKLAGQLADTKRAIQNTAPTASAAMAGLLAADYNGQTKLGELFRSAEEYNQAQREKVLGFNRETEALNSEGLLKADIANKEADKLKLQSAIYQANLRNQIDATASAAKSANLTNLFDNMGAVGKESYIMNMIEKNPALLYNWLGEYKNSSACGGMLTKRKRRKK